jgi:hypothetical protein
MADEEIQVHLARQFISDAWLARKRDGKLSHFEVPTLPRSVLGRYEGASICPYEEVSIISGTGAAICTAVLVV